MAKVLNLNKLRQDMKQSEGIEDSRQTKSTKKCWTRRKAHCNKMHGHESHGN